MDLAKNDPEIGYIQRVRPLGEIHLINLVRGGEVRTPVRTEKDKASVRRLAHRVMRRCGHVFMTRTKVLRGGRQEIAVTRIV